MVKHHGVHNLEKKQLELKINYSNKNDISDLIGPPSTKSTFDNDVYIYIERKYNIQYIYVIILNQSIFSLDSHLIRRINMNDC